ncbi:kinase-like domain-containing protein [Pyronema domesticum]|uniref:Similar to Tyrosine-protein kinase HCK acc. no. P08631 n=1 Tax=Pyronema omphalodes (strain CBS 100304) TaxID=1076935 RepID=U4LRV1_PYROM|nr:kinase-like domain-containing protein [Pyronema domesticum]CCX34901.1 Similar to Tyrosine-protein kinase HCK; acc. no. P08631 [Pyronema omphalodes CBS 100304]
MADMYSTMYGGYGGYTELAVISPTTNTFWDDRLIEETLTPTWIRKNLPQSAQKQLNEQLKYAEGLTECTYEEWILEKVRKFFVILVEIGVPEKIFDVIDGSWDDDDLPLPQANIETLGLGAKAEKIFFKKQRTVMVRAIEPGSHIDYADDEIVPIEVISSRLPASRANSVIDKVYLPRQADVYYSRRRVQLGDALTPDSMSTEMFLGEVNAMRSMSHDHIVNVHASYTQGEFGYIILTPLIEQNLKSFLSNPPQTFKALDKAAKKSLLLDWMHCLTDALAFLHEEGVAHGDLKPTSIIIDSSHKIYLADIGNTRVLDPRQILDMERYEYGAPELWARKLSTHEISPATTPVSTSITSRLRIRRVPSGHSSPDSLSPTSSSFHFEKPISLDAWRNTSNTYWNSDVFSLGACFADILSFYAKRKPSAFLQHRTSKRRGSRDGVAPDTSFHANLPQVDSWMEELEKYGRGKHDETYVLAASVTREMLHRDSAMRPDARASEQCFYRVTLERSNYELPHCGEHEEDKSRRGIRSGYWARSARSGSITTDESELSEQRVEERLQRLSVAEEKKKTKKYDGVNPAMITGGGFFANQWA